MIKALVFSALVALPLAAIGAKGGEPNNRDCNGVGNVNSPCVGDTKDDPVPDQSTKTSVVSTGGSGGSSSSVSSSTASGGNASVSGVTATGGTSTATGGSQSQHATASLGGVSTDVSVVTVNNEAQVPTKVTVRNTPDAAALIASPTANCRVTFGGGASAPGFGITIGSSALDEGCNRRETSRHLHNMGYVGAAIQVMCADHVARPALLATGVVCNVEVTQ